MTQNLVFFAVPMNIVLNKAKAESTVRVSFLQNQ